VLAVDNASAGAGADTQALMADGHAAVGADLQGRAHAPDIRPPRTARPRPSVSAAAVAETSPRRNEARTSRIRGAPRRCGSWR